MITIQNDKSYTTREPTSTPTITRKQISEYLNKSSFPFHKSANILIKIFFPLTGGACDPQTQYTCPDSRCIFLANVCDSLCDCKPGCEDEMNCSVSLYTKIDGKYSWEVLQECISGKSPKWCVFLRTFRCFPGKSFSCVFLRTPSTDVFLRSLSILHSWEFLQESIPKNPFSSSFLRTCSSVYS